MNECDQNKWIFMLANNTDLQITREDCGLEVELMTPLLCRLGLHKWKNFGEVVMTSWKEPGAFPGTTTKIKKYLHSERKCSRCGIMEKRIFADNPDGTKAPMGWTKTSEETQKSEG